MINVLNSKQIKAYEKEIIDSGISENILIERAAEKLFSHIKNLELKSGKINKNTKILVLAGGGNNGSDGFSLALMLLKNGYNVRVCLTHKHFNEYCKERINRLKNLTEIIYDYKEISEINFDIIIDAIIGIGLKSEINDYIKEIVRWINGTKSYIIAVDIPSGLNADNGTTMGGSVTANETVTFICYKTGLIIGEAKNYCGRITVYDIGIKTESDRAVIEHSDIIIENRKAVSHKYDYGTVKIIGGSDTMVGAPLIAFESARAALKSGAGLTVLCVNETNKLSYSQRVKEEMLYFLKSDANGLIFDSDNFDGIINKADSIVIGMGMKPDDELKKSIKYLIDNYGGTLILDAGALTAVADNTQITLNHKCKLILTPHAGEFERIKKALNKKIDFVNDDEVKNIELTAAFYNAVVVYKSAFSIITDGTKTVFSSFGPPCLAKGGTGDALSGMIAPLALRYGGFKGAYYGCYFLAKAGNRAEETLSSDSVLASDIVNNIIIK